MTKPLDPNETHPQYIADWLSHHLGIHTTPEQQAHLEQRRAARLATIATPLDVPPTTRTTTRIASATRTVNNQDPTP
jgi:hypothetical protein